MKSKKGFTLVELLAVITVLALVMVIAGLSVSRVRKNANVELAKKLEDTLKGFGPDIYAAKKEAGEEVSGKYGIDYLKDYGYLKGDIANPNGNGSCEGYVEIEKSGEELAFSGHVCCPGVYQTNIAYVPDEEECQSYSE